MRREGGGRGWTGGALAAVVGCVVLAGCAALPSAPEEPLKEATAEQLVQLLEERESAIQTMKGLFKVQVKGPGLPFSQRVQGAVFYRRPQAMRLQAFTPFGGELFEFVLGDDRYRLRIPSMGQHLSGPVAELDRVGDLRRPFRLSLLAMSGAVGIASVPKTARVQLFEDGGRYRLDVHERGQAGETEDQPATRRIWFERRSLQVVQEERLTGTGEIDATLQCEDFRPVGEGNREGESLPPAAPTATAMLRPFKITAEDGQGQGWLVLTFQEMIPNPPLTSVELGSTGSRRNDERGWLSAEWSPLREPGEGTP